MIKRSHIVYRQLVAMYFVFAVFIAVMYYGIYPSLFNAMAIFSTVFISCIGIMAIVEELST